MNEEVSSTPLAWQGEARRRGAGIRAAAVVRSGLFAGRIAERIAEVSEHWILEDNAGSAGYSKLLLRIYPRRMATMEFPPISRKSLYRGSSPIALIRLAGLMSVQCAETYSRHFLRVSWPYTTFQPAGTALKAGHSECWFSSFTRTRHAPSSSSNGFATDSPDESIKRPSA